MALMSVGSSHNVGRNGRQAELILIRHCAASLPKAALTYMRILLVEDEKGLIVTLSDRLTSEGFEVTSATDGELGLGLAIGGQFDLIILDVMLPKKNGYDVARDLRQKG